MGKYFLAISSLVAAIQPLPFSENITTSKITNPPAIIVSTTTTAPTKTSEVILTEEQVKPKLKIATTTKVWVTAYSSTPEETDDTPFVTAYMTDVRDGIVATNMFPFGTKIQIPKFFGEKIFIVEDKMHRRKKNFIDIWMPNKESAKKFGIHTTEAIVLEN